MDTVRFKSAGFIIALVVLVVDVCLMVVGGVDFKVGGLTAGLAVAEMLS